jgi:hypothetical protein
LLAPIEGGGQGYFILLGATKAEVRRLLSQLRRNHQSLTRARIARMETLVSGSRALDAGDPDRTKALMWVRLTADQLVMKQMGTGMYAGLPWFNDYWGRDTFISITGTLFVTGQYEVAADVFRSFAALQDTDPKSKTYGRIPNRARPDGVQYNTADGTPRFIITLADLVHRTGDLALARELSPTVKRAIEGMLAHDLDESGFVTHGDADTWMDAKEKGVRAFSPRGNRAIDIQALWIEALEAAIGLMFLNVGLVIGRREIDAKKAMAQSLTDHFVDKATGKLVDHLKPDGSPDLAVRPNAFFALDILEKYNPRIHTDEIAVQKQKMIWAPSASHGSLAERSSNRTSSCDLSPRTKWKERWRVGTSTPGWLKWATLGKQAAIASACAGAIVAPVSSVCSRVFFGSASRSSVASRLMPSAAYSTASASSMATISSRSRVKLPSDKW